ncbi:MAG: hypothetical protein R3343_03395 [Nitriliruptorales bacterium]|nr:hypothetical protein [Nitriliruptorales bacterium]
MEVLFLVLGAVVAAGVFFYNHWRKQKLDEAWRTMLKRDGLTATYTPCGRSSVELILFRALPQGDRNYGVEHAATGPVEISLGEQRVTAECAAFVWWWEVRQQSTDAKGHTSTRYAKRTEVVGMLQVPYQLPSVSIAPESLLAKLGIGGRGDFQVESERFNSRFDVRVSEPELGIRLLDPSFQRFLLEMFDGRQIELAFDSILVAGDPAGEDASLFGEVKELPGARRDVQLVASRIPASFWRALRHDGRDAGGETDR